MWGVILVKPLGHPQHLLTLLVGVVEDVSILNTS
jgi:hypothetical protein